MMVLTDDKISGVLQNPNPNSLSKNKTWYQVMSTETEPKKITKVQS